MYLERKILVASTQQLFVYEQALEWGSKNVSILKLAYY